MKTTKLIIITIIIAAFGMAVNAFGQPAKKKRVNGPKKPANHYASIEVADVRIKKTSSKPGIRRPKKGITVKNTSTGKRMHKPRSTRGKRMHKP